MVAIAAMLSAMTSPGPASGANGTLEVECSGLRNETGQVVCALFDNADAFPREERIYAGAVVRIEGGRALCRFANVPAGRYAAAVFHDEDGDRKLKKRLGRPVEGFGFSNDAKLRTFGPPTFEAASFDFDGKSKRIAIRMRYP